MFLSGGLPAFDVVGLPDAAVRESRERVRAAVKKTAEPSFLSAVSPSIWLLPAAKREGTLYDLPIFWA